MNYSDEEIALAKRLFAKAMRDGRPRRFGVAAVAGMSGRMPIAHVIHERSWRDYLVKARRQLRS